LCVGDDAQPTISAAAARLLAGPLSPRLCQLLAATLDWAGVAGNTVVTLHDARYPSLLREIPDPPLLLYVKGRSALLQQPAIAIVGARKASLQGQHHARHFARVLADAGQVIVSGLALGIDAAAHAGGLEGAASSVAVIGTGIDRIYPRRNAELARQLAGAGCVISEFALGAPSRAEHFPIRNRIIAGLARATLVIEAAAQSGSLITAHQAMAFGREVLVMPGSVHSALTKGCHFLIREGARLVETPDDVLQDLGLAPATVRPAALAAAAGLLLETLSFDPLHADELAARLQLDPAETQASLLALELAGVVERLPGGSFQRLKSVH
jgi:DNA processing protein